MGGVKTNGPTVIHGYELTPPAVFSLTSIVGTNNAGLNINKARPILARAEANRKAEGVRFIAESHIIAADGELFRERLEGRDRPNYQTTQARPGGTRSGRGRGAPIDDS